jgi:hypothetical protein
MEVVVQKTLSRSLQNQRHLDEASNSSENSPNNNEGKLILSENRVEHIFKIQFGERFQFEFKRLTYFQ